MITPLLELLETVAQLGVLSLEERHQYEDNILKLKRKWYEEFQRPDSEISHFDLDEYQLQLRLLTEAFIQTLRTKKTKN